MKKGRKTASDRVELGRYIVADPEICHGQPTFKGTRIMVWQVLDDVAAGRSWEYICNVRWGGRIPLTAVAEAIKLAETAWLERPSEWGWLLGRTTMESNSGSEIERPCSEFAGSSDRETDPLLLRSPISHDRHHSIRRLRRLTQISPVVADHWLTGWC